MLRTAVLLQPVVAGPASERRRDVVAHARGFGSKPQAEQVPAEQRCPCGSSDGPYSLCCKPVISGERKAETPAALLRSRFTAYARGEGAYVLATTLAPKTGQADDIAASASKLRYSALTVVDEACEGLDNASISFTYEVVVVGQAGFGARAQGRARVHETSKFVRKDGAWMYDVSTEQRTEDL